MPNEEIGSCSPQSENARRLAHYLYIGPPEPDLTLAQNGEYVSCMGERYRIDRAEKVYKGSEVFYIWAIIRVIVEND